MGVGWNWLRAVNNGRISGVGLVLFTYIQSGTAPYSNWTKIHLHLYPSMFISQLLVLGMGFPTGYTKKSASPN
jgi:hypothetical protein